MNTLSIKVFVGIINSKIQDSGCLSEWRKENQNRSNTKKALNKSVILMSYRVKAKARILKEKGTSLKISELQEFLKNHKNLSGRKKNSQRNKNQIDRFLISHSEC